MTLKIPLCIPVSTLIFFSDEMLLDQVVVFSVCFLNSIRASNPVDMLLNISSINLQVITVFNLM